MTQELLKEIKQSGVVETGEQIAMVELGAATMLPCLAAALNYSQCTCFATDVASVLPQMEETCRLNGSLPNVVPMAFKFGSTGTSLLDLKKLIEKRSLKRVNYIVCVEQIYDSKNFKQILQTLKGISLINKSLWEKAGCLEELRMPKILMTHNLKKTDIIKQFFDLAADEFEIEETIGPEVLVGYHPDPACKLVKLVYRGTCESPHF